MGGTTPTGATVGDDPLLAGVFRASVRPLAIARPLDARRPRANVGPVNDTHVHHMLNFLRSSRVRLHCLMSCVLLAPMVAPQTASAGALAPHSGHAHVGATLRAVASDSLSGRVVDAGGKGIAAVTVTLVEARLTTLTDADGRFSLARVPVGTYTLVTRRLGYASATAVIAVPHTPLVVSLVAAPFDVAPVTVTASRGAGDALHSVLPVSAVSSDALRQNEGISLGHAVSHLPGVRNVSTGSAIGKPMIHGLFGPRVLVTQDGSRLEDYSWSEEDGPSVDARVADRVEVIRGAASVLYGSDAIGGVVNVVPEALPSTNGGASFRRASIDAYGASNNIELGSSLKVDGANGNFGWRVLGIGRVAQNYHTPVGEQIGTAFFAVNGEAAVAYRRDRSVTTLRFSQYGGEFKLIEAGTPVVILPDGKKEAGPDRKALDNRVQLVHDYTINSQWRLETKAQWQRHSLIEVSDDACATGAVTVGCDSASLAAAAAKGQTEQPAFDLLLNTGTLDVLAHHTFGGGVRGTIGVSTMWQSNDSRGPIFLIPSGNTASTGAFLFEEVTVDRITFTAGGRVDARHITTDANSALRHAATSKSWTEPTGDIGLVFRALPHLALVGNVGTAWRAPTFFDLYSNGPHLAESRYELGDSLMVPERSVELGGGVRVEAGRVRGEVSAYRNAVRDYIYTAPTSVLVQGFQLFRHVQGDARLTGAEAWIEAQLAVGVVARARHDFVRGKLTATLEPLPLMPPPRSAFELEWRGVANRAARHAGLEVERTGRQNRAPANDFVTGSYTLVNVDAGTGVVAVGRTFQLDLSVRNVADTQYKNFLSRYKAFAYEPGRNVVLRVSTGIF